MFETLRWDDFSGGLNIRDEVSELASNEFPWSRNMLVTREGALSTVFHPSGTFGFGRDLGSGFAAHEMFWFETADASTQKFIVAGSAKWTVVDHTDFYSAGALAAAGLTDIRTGMTAHDDTTFIVHDDKLYGLDPRNIMATWDGTTLDTHADGVDTGPPPGIILGIWNGKMWTAVATAGVVGMEIAYSEVFDATNGFVDTTGIWPAANRVTLGGGGAGGERIVGGAVCADGLVVFTNRSMYLIYDSDDGFNTRIDSSGGCVSRRAIVRHDEMIYGINQRGIFRTTGRLPLEYLSGKIEPWFDGGRSISEDAADAASAVVLDDHLVIDVQPDDSGGRATWAVNLSNGAISWLKPYAFTDPLAEGESPLMRMVSAPGGGTYAPIVMSIGVGGDALQVDSYANNNGPAGGVKPSGIQLGYAGQRGDTIGRLREVRAICSGSISIVPATDFMIGDHSSSLPFAAVTLSMEDDAGPVEGTIYNPRTFGKARVSGVRGRVFSAMVGVPSPGNSSAALGPAFPLPVASKLGTRISMIEMRVMRSSRRD